LSRGIAAHSAAPSQYDRLHEQFRISRQEIPWTTKKNAKKPRRTNMKVTTSKNGQRTLNLSHSEWLAIGQKTRWLEKEAGVGDDIKDWWAKGRSQVQQMRPRTWSDPTHHKQVNWLVNWLQSNAKNLEVTVARLEKGAKEIPGVDIEKLIETIRRSHQETVRTIEAIKQQNPEVFGQKRTQPYKMPAWGDQSAAQQTPGQQRASAEQTVKSLGGTVTWPAPTTA
jgi:hypothetical protein